MSDDEASDIGLEDGASPDEPTQDIPDFYRRALPIIEKYLRNLDFSLYTNGMRETTM
jgi:hypothetical protein